MNVNTFFSESDKKRIISSIESAEKNTSGEGRLHLDKHCKGDPVERAIQLFGKLNMHKTELRNGVLFYLAIEDHKFSIIGDQGINEVVPDDFWDSTRDLMLSHFKNGDFLLGICEGIEEAGKQLKAHFPFQTNDSNELSNDISFQEN